MKNFKIHQYETTFIKIYLNKNIDIFVYIQIYFAVFQPPPSSPSHPNFPLSPPRSPLRAPLPAHPYQPPTPTPSIQVLLIVPPALPPSLTLPHPLAVTPPITFQYRVNLDVYHRYAVSGQYNYVLPTIPSLLQTLAMILQSQVPMLKVVWTRQLRYIFVRPG